MVSSIRIVPNIQLSELQAMGTSRTGPLYLFAVKTGAKVQTQAAQNLSGKMVKVRSGNLRSSLHSTTEIRGSLLVESVIADASYALMVHDGTEAHDIVPREARVLAWQGASGPAFAMRVHHPGTAGRPFLTDALSVI